MAKMRKDIHGILKSPAEVEFKSPRKRVNSQRAYHNIYQQLYGNQPSEKVTITESDADIMSQGRGFMSAFDYTMQLQVGCPAGCLFCYVRQGFRHAPVKVQRDWGFDVRNKRNAGRKFKKALERGTLADKTLYWSGVTDPYAAKPEETQNLWRILCETPLHLRPRRIAVQTRFRPDRDAFLMAQYAQSTATSDDGPPVVISYSIGTDRNDLIRAWERATPRFEERIKSIEALRQAGLFVVPTLSPFGLWNDLPSALEQFKAWDIAYITVLFFKEGGKWSNTPKPFLEYLRHEYPVLLSPDWQEERLKEMKAIYGRERVWVGKAGFDSLASPHRIAA